MTRRRFYAPPDAFSPDRKSASLGADETRHLRDVLRLKSGDEVYLFDGAGREFRCQVETIARDSTAVRVAGQVDPACPESLLNLTLAVALLKGEKFDLVIQKATELGVTNVVPVITARADVRLKSEEDADRKVIRWQRIALEATKQCGRAHLMKIEKPIGFADFIKPASEPVVRLMFAERGGASLASATGVTSHQLSKVTAIVGPEGGWTDDEIEVARKAGWQIVTLGGRTLRAETAAIVIATLIQHHFGDLK